MSHALLKELKDKIEEADQIKAKLVEDLKPKFKEIFEPILAKWPELLAIKWTQYTPYFNDGETCEFSVHNLDWAIKGIDGDSEREVDGEDDDTEELSFDDGIPGDWYFEFKDDDSDYKNKYLDQATASFGTLERYMDFRQDQKEVQKSFKELPAEVLEDLFGDHAEIIVTRKGLDVTEYEHD